MASRFTIPVRLNDESYAVQVEPGLLHDAGRAVRELTASKKVGVVTDDHVAGWHLGPLRRSLAAHGFEVIEAVLPNGEVHKTLADLLPVFDRLLSARVDRATPVIALGGGVVGDMAGFVAATALRGLPFIQVPTTLLAMVDASVGGKTGVNHPSGKNLIGAFHQPIGVLIDPSVLATLPPCELRGGLAECIKHDVIRDAEGFGRLERDVGRALDVDIDYLAELVAHNVAIKARVVEGDPFEHGERAHLNFGHTFAHAIETVTEYAYSHGEAVALGMVAASQLAAALGLLDAASVARIRRVIDRAGLPVKGAAAVLRSADRIVAAMGFDKKVKAGKVRFVLPTRIGEVIVRDDVPAEEIRRAVESILG